MSLSRDEGKGSDEDPFADLDEAEANYILGYFSEPEIKTTIAKVVTLEQLANS